MNTQPIEKQVHRPTGALDVHSVFLTIQGEGPFTGCRAVFVRLAGCNLQCPMCDTDYTSERELVTPDELVEKCRAPITNPHLVVITGGEPFRQNLRPAVEALLAAGFEVQIETNGTLYQDLPYEEITIVCSPKTGSINKQLADKIHSLKYVLHADGMAEDGLPVLALGHSAKPRLARPPEGFAGTVYLQAVDEGSVDKNGRHIRAVISSVITHGHVLCLQTHKILNLE